MPPTALRSFQTEFLRLKSLYETTQYSYAESARTLIQKIKTREIDPREPIKLGPSDDKADSNAFAIVRRLRSQFPRYLRETILVRLISSLEVFLLDVVREVFLARRDLFHAESRRLDFSYGELLSASSVTELWSKVINRDIRSLQNQGFKEIARFYRAKLGIDLADCGIAAVRFEEFHARRHILVHRLGRTDDEYRHRFNTDIKRLTVTDDYLFGCMSDLSRLADWVHEMSAKKMAETAPVFGKPQADYVVRITVEVLSDNVPEILTPVFDYNVGENIHRLGDLLASHTIESKTHTLTIGGEASVVRGYLKLLRASESQGYISIREKSLVKGGNELRLKWKFSDHLLKEIWETLPAQPWPKHLHKQVAQKFKLSNSQAAIAVGLFLQSLQSNGRPPSKISPDNGSPPKSSV